MIKAFISHSSKQKEFAQELYKKVGGDFCYIDCYDFQPAFKTIDEIYAKIDSCTIFVLLLSKESLTSDWVKKEISAAIRKFSPNQLDRFWPFIIDPELTVDECPDWIRKDECFNLKFFRSPEQLRKDIEQKFRRIVWMENPGIMARETTLIGRQEELGQFEDIRYSKGGSEIRALVISGRTGVGKDAFARQCLYLMKYEHETEPYRISLENKSSIEDFIVQLNLITDVYSNDELKGKLNGTLEQKIDLAVDLLVVSRLLETEAAVPCDDEQGVRATVLNAQFVNDSLEIAVDVATDDDRLDVRVVVLQVGHDALHVVLQPRQHHLAREHGLEDAVVLVEERLGRLRVPHEHVAVDLHAVFLREVQQRLHRIEAHGGGGLVVLAELLAGRHVEHEVAL